MEVCSVDCCFLLTYVLLRLLFGDIFYASLFLLYFTVAFVFLVYTVCFICARYSFPVTPELFFAQFSRLASFN